MNEEIKTEVPAQPESHPDEPLPVQPDEEVQQDILDLVDVMAAGDHRECSHAEAVLEQANRIVQADQTMRDEVKSAKDALLKNGELLSRANDNVVDMNKSVKDLIADTEELVDLTDEYVAQNVTIRMQANYAVGIAIGACVVACACLAMSAVVVANSI